MSNRIIPSFALMIAVALFFLYVNPTWSGSIAQMKAKIASDDKALEAATQYSGQQNQLATEQAAIDQKYPDSIDRLTRFLPNSVDNVRLILDLNALAAKSGLSLSNVDVSTAASTDSNAGNALSASSDIVGSVDLSLSAVGTYTALNSFLSGIERSQRLLDVQDLSVKGSDTGVYTYQMKIRIYWLR